MKAFLNFIREEQGLEIGEYVLLGVLVLGVGYLAYKNMGAKILTNTNKVNNMLDDSNQLNTPTN